MEKVRYMISDAADIVSVESHVLRYWEDELELEVPRNELGHRYYTKENIQEFQRIKDLKEQGYQLKAIRMIVHNGVFDESLENIEGSTGGDNSASDGPNSSVPSGLPISFSSADPVAGQSRSGQSSGAQVPGLAETTQSILDNTDKMSQFTDLMTQIVGKAIAANNSELSRNISEGVGEQVVKEMNYLMREREEAEEERFRRLDVAIRGNLKSKDTKKWGKKKRTIGQPEGA